MPFDPSKITLKIDEKAFIAWYDARCKRILSNRMVLAHLLKSTMAEFANLEPEIITSRYIEGVPVQLKQEDYDMTAGEQIIYCIKRDISEAQEKAKEEEKKRRRKSQNL